jgi:hypothetical protein
MPLTGIHLAFAAGIAAGTPAYAATPEAAAQQQVATAETAARTTLRAALAAAQIQLFAAISNVELALPAAASPLEPGNDLFDGLAAFQRATFVAENLASQAQAEGAKAALATLGADGGIYPDAFYPGLGTPTERFETAIGKDTAKAYAKVGKRLVKLVARFAAEGFALNVRLRPPTFTDSRNWSETIVDFVTVFPPTVDLVVAWSDLAVLGDGQLRAAGTGTQLTGGPIETGPVLLSAVAHPGTDVNIDKEVTPVESRWTTDLDGAALPEGVYLLVAGQQTILGADVSIGVR